MIIRPLAGAAIAALLALPGRSADGQTGHRVEAEFTDANGTRRYAVWIPGTLDSRTSMPLVVVLHGCLQDAADIARGSRFDERADEDEFLVLYPEQPATVIPTKCWRWFDPAHQGRDAGETELIAALTREVSREYHADTSRIYVAGISAGGAMAINLLAAYPDLFAAGAAHSAIPYKAATSVVEALGAMRDGSPGDTIAEHLLTASAARRAPPRLLVIHGGKDPVVAPRNGALLAEQWRRAAEHWLGHALDSVVVDSTSNGYTVRRATFRRAGRTWIERWTVLELGHAWSGGSKAGTYTDTSGPRATDVIARFFDLRAPRP